MLNVFKSYRNFWEGCIRGLLFLSLLAPLWVGGRYLFPFVFPKAIYFEALIEIALVIYLGLVLADKSYLPKLNVLVLSVSLWIAAVGLSTLFGFNPRYSFWSKAERMDGLFWYLHIYAFFVMLTSVFKKEKHWLYLLEWSSVVGLLAGCLALLSKYTQIFPFGDQSRLGGTFGNPAFLGTYFVVGIFLNLLLFFWAAERWQKIFWGGAVGFSGLMVLMSGTRGAFVGGLAGLAVLAFLVVLLGKQSGYRKLGLGIFAGMGVLGLSLVLTPDLWKHYLPFLSSRIFSLWQIPEQRILVWKMGWEAFKQKPIFGWGQENFVYVFNKFFNPAIYKYEIAIFDRPHNKLVDLLVSQGALGLAAYLGIFVVMAWGILRKIFNRLKAGIGKMGPVQQRHTLGLAILAGLWAAYFVQDLVLFDMPTSAILMFLGLGFSAWLIFDAGEGIVPERNSTPAVWQKMNFLRNSLWFITAVLISLGFYQGIWRPLGVSSSAIKNLALMDSTADAQKFSQAHAYYKKARQANTFLNKEVDMNTSRRLRGLSYTPLQGYQAEYQQMLLEVSYNLEQDLVQYKGDYDILNEAGNLYLLLQTKLGYPAQDNLRRVLDKAIVLAPNRFEARETYFIYHLLTNSQAEAQKDLQGLFSLGNEIGNTWFYQACYEARWGDVGQVAPDIVSARKFGFDINSRLAEQQILLNAFVARHNYQAAIDYLGYMLENTKADAVQQLRYRLAQVELYYYAGKLDQAKALLNDLLASATSDNQTSILQYLKNRGVELK